MSAQNIDLQNHDVTLRKAGVCALRRDKLSRPRYRKMLTELKWLFQVLSAHDLTESLPVKGFVL